MRLIALTLAASLLAACSWNDATDAKPQPPVVIRDDAPEYDDPEAEAWFRTPRAFEPERVVAGDLVSIHASLEQSGRNLAGVAKRVPPNGEVRLPHLKDAVQFLDKTPQELEKEIGDLYESTEEYERPYVLVAVEEAASRDVFLIGAVEGPGRYDLGSAAQTTLLKAITLAGGPKPTADLTRVRIQRFFPARNAEVASPPLDLQQVIDDGIQDDNLVLEPGDTVMIPEQKDLFVYVTGHTTKNGPLAWREGMTLSEAVSEMGGFQRFAKRTKIVINRRKPDGSTETIAFDYDEFLDGDIEDLDLHPGDSIFVPEKWI